MLPEELNKDDGDLLEKLYKGSYVAANDWDKIANLYERIQQGKREAINMRDFDIQVTMTDRFGNSIQVCMVFYLDIKSGIFYQSDREASNGFAGTQLCLYTV